MGFKCGIIGLPNVGKSTLFNALTKSNIKAANFPFCTIEPNIGVVPVPDTRLNQLAEIVKSQRILPTTIEFVDIAGLVQGAHRGNGLGNHFLTRIRETEALGQVVRCFKQDDIIHVTGKINPIEDISIINTELILADLDTCKRTIQRISKKAQYGDKKAKVELVVLKKCLLQLDKIKMLNTLDLSKKEKDLIRYLNFLTMKPILYIANINENGFENNPYLDLVRTIADKESSIVVPVCAIAATNNNGPSLEETNLSSVIRAGYNLLNLQTYFTAGIKETRAWTIPIGSTALQAAGKIHTDFKKGFIRAKTISFEDFIAFKGEQGAKEAGKMRLEGRDYIVKDGDVMNFLFNI